MYGKTKKLLKTTSFSCFSALPLLTGFENQRKPLTFASLMEITYLTIKDAAKILGVAPLTLRNWDKRGILSAYRNPINNYRVYRRDQIDLFLRRIENSKNRQSGRKIDISLI